MSHLPVSHVDEIERGLNYLASALMQRLQDGVRCLALPFETTRWSLVLAAAGSDSQAAREAFCRKVADKITELPRIQYKPK